MKSISYFTNTFTNTKLLKKYKPLYQLKDNNIVINAKTCQGPQLYTHAKSLQFQQLLLGVKFKDR